MYYTSTLYARDKDDNINALKPTRNLRMEEQFDAILYVGPKSSITYSSLSPELCVYQSYRKMRAAPGAAVRRPGQWIGRAAQKSAMTYSRMAGWSPRAAAKLYRRSASAYRLLRRGCPPDYPVEPPLVWLFSTDDSNFPNCSLIERLIEDGRNIRRTFACREECSGPHDTQSRNY
jgi:hypothetical protein